jgi:hypothetical protein
MMTEYDVMPAVDCIGDANSRLVDAAEDIFFESVHPHWRRLVLL